MPTDQNLCELCGEPMPPGEEMFKFHGYSGPCPKPPKPEHVKASRGVKKSDGAMTATDCPTCTALREALEAEATALLAQAENLVAASMAGAVGSLVSEARTVRGIAQRLSALLTATRPAAPQDALCRAHAALDAADLLMARHIETTLPGTVWQEWRRTHRQALCAEASPAAPSPQMTTPTVPADRLRAVAEGIAIDWSHGPDHVLFQCSCGYATSEFEDIKHHVAQVHAAPSSQESDTISVRRVPMSPETRTAISEALHQGKSSREPKA